MAFLFSVSLCGCDINDTSDSSAVSTADTSDPALSVQNKYQLKITDSPGALEMIQSIYPAGDDFFVPGYGETEKSEEAVKLIDIEKKTSEDIIVFSESENIISTLLNDDKIYVCFSDSLGRIRLRVTDKNSKKTEKEAEIKFEENSIVFVRQIFAGNDGSIYLLANVSNAENDKVRKDLIYSLDEDLKISQRTELGIQDEKGDFYSALKIQACEDCFWLLAGCSADSESDTVDKETGKMFRLSRDFKTFTALQETDENDFSSVYDFGTVSDGNLILCMHSHDALSENNYIIKLDTQNMTINGTLASDDIERVFFSSVNENEVYYSESDGILYRYDFELDEKTNMSDENDTIEKDTANAVSIDRNGTSMLVTCLQEENVDSVLMYRISSDGEISDGVAVSSVFENGYSDRIFIADDGCFLTFEKTNVIFGNDFQTTEMPAYLINRCSDSGKITGSLDVSVFLGTDAEVSSDALFSDKKSNNYLLCSIEGKIKKQSKLLVTDKYGRKLLASDIHEKYDHAQFITSKEGELFLALLLKNKVVLYNIDAENGLLSEKREPKLQFDDDSDSFLSIYQGRESSDIYLLSEKGCVYGLDLSSDTFDLLFDSDFTNCVPDSMEIGKVFPLSDDKIVFTAYTDDAEEKICIVSKCEP